MPKTFHQSYRGLLTSIIFTFFVLGCNGPQKEAQGNEEFPTLYVTTLDQRELLEAHPLKKDHASPIDAHIIVDSTKVFQQMDGFGYTLTGGSALHLQKMSEETRKNLLQTLFGTDSSSIGVSYLRLSIGASDLDEKPWSYDDLENGETDLTLEKFSLGYDTLYLIPTLKEILKISPKIKLMGSPWSPPPWMKDNKDTRGGTLMPQYYDVYAQYLLKYIQAMHNEGISIDALTVQNEPLHPGNNPSLLMPADEQAAFIKHSLGPLFAAHGVNTKILIYDHNADRPDYPLTILNDPEAAKYIDGSAFHLYGGTIDALSEVHEAHPDKNIYFTEQWIGAPGNFKADFSWHIDNLIIGASRNWSKTVLQWNLAADENEEPHTDRGGCTRCLGALTITGDSVIRNPAYYIVAQAPKFVPPGSFRVDSNTFENFPNVAFKTPEGHIVVLIQNKNDTTKNIQVTLGNAVYTLSLQAGAVGSLVI